MYIFATLFDKNYLTRGLALYSSMQKHIDNFVLYVLALDNEVFKYIEEQNFNNLKAIKITDVEKKYPELIIAKNNRTIVEYYFTLSPVLPLYMLETYPEIDFITTLDADIFFFSNPKPIFDKFQNYSILITAHDFPEVLKYAENAGIYNVSFQSFRNDNEGLLCLKHWKEQCIEWCYDYIENNRYADQKYLDNWNEKYKKVMILKGNGSGIAPWNLLKYKISKLNNDVFCNNNKIIFYHFHGLRFVRPKLIIHSLNTYKVKTNKEIRKYIYKPYIKEILKNEQQSKFANTNVVRGNNKYTGKRFFNLLVFNYTYLFYKGLLINIHLKPIYDILKYSIFLPIVILKQIYRKIKNKWQNF